MWNSFSSSSVWYRVYVWRPLRRRPLAPTTKNIENEHISGCVLLVGGTLDKGPKHECTKEIPRTESEGKKRSFYCRVKGTKIRCIILALIRSKVVLQKPKFTKIIKNFIHFLKHEGLMRVRYKQMNAVEILSIYLTRFLNCSAIYFSFFTVVSFIRAF